MLVLLMIWVMMIVLLIDDVEEGLIGAGGCDNVVDHDGGDNDDVIDNVDGVIHGGVGVVNNVIDDEYDMYYCDDDEANGGEVDEDEMIDADDGLIDAGGH